ncbi:MAG TPA: SgcJ/EcaC family oxidoreductase [Allosphingosinicella sp.]|nr:SgcJ/EcaC family oxidoreductase [Allosphingosinicella sp.]
MTRTALLLAAATGLTACQPAAAPKTDTAAIENDLKQAETRWNQAYAAHDAAALAAMYADDAALASPGSALVSGKEGVRKETAAMAADPNLKVQFASDRVQVAASGDLAYTRGHYTLAMTDPNTKKPAESGGSYLTVWKKQSDGSWKAVEDFITPGPAAEK